MNWKLQDEEFQLKKKKKKKIKNLYPITYYNKDFESNLR